MRAPILKADVNVSGIKDYLVKTKLGEIHFFDDYSYIVNVESTEYKKSILLAVNEVILSRQAIRHYHDRREGGFFKFSKLVFMGDAEFLLGLLDTVADKINHSRANEILSFEITQAVVL